MEESLVSADLLDKLRCHLCNLYLSVFPIYINDKGNEFICGRCNVQHEDKYIRDGSYEDIAQYIIFPCAHSVNGCKQQMCPQKLALHELCCAFRKLDCPNRSYSDCVWKGSINKLRDHFENSHRALFINDGKFEINFNNSLREYLLFFTENELFLVKKEIDSINGIFSCSVKHVIQIEDSKKYNYSLRIETANQFFNFHECSKRTVSIANEEKISFSNEFINEQLSYPETIIINVIIDEMEIQKSQIANIPKIEDSNTNLAIFNELECPICYEYMLPPIFQCLSGHSICNICKPKIVFCSICKGNIKYTRNFTLENLVTQLSYPCKYSKVGCPIALKAGSIEQHQDLCEFGSYECPLAKMENCIKKLNKNEINRHIETEHESYLLKFNKVNVTLNMLNDGRYREYYIIKFDKKLFKLCFAYFDFTFFWAIQLIYPSEDYIKYQLEIDIIDNSGNNLRAYARRPCMPYTKTENFFEVKGTYIMFLYEQINDFLTDKTLSYQARVVNGTMM
ncbi:uncharacterized protein LOC115891313 [Sitophilus oryzae]|uniref:RING-type E3 ubiquitin transferase n=1 Tax=Sitophilus oryzae TaxID=7048 RepID=A0A6J2YWP7_SITOR|nr:uncharacterized protein LOC115891313 [Sitophilus oryzae]